MSDEIYLILHLPGPFCTFCFLHCLGLKTGKFSCCTTDSQTGVGQNQLYNNQLVLFARPWWWSGTGGLIWALSRSHTLVALLPLPVPPLEEVVAAELVAVVAAAA